MNKLIPGSTLLLVIDVQERLAAAMPEAGMTRLIQRAELLLEAARLLDVRVLATEQYPKGLGTTVPALASRLSAMACTPMEKMDFDATSDLAIAQEVAKAKARHVVLIGMETHICVFQTARALVQRGYDTHVVMDAVVSRTEENREIGLSLSRQAGAVITSAEAVVFDWLGRAGSDDFKAISKLVR